MTENKNFVSIIIVSMNNLKNLFPCLNSIIQNTHVVDYEIIVVAYLFSKENIFLLKSTYPCVKIIESNEIRGFSENNNLALKQVQGTYCFILNDDTTFDMPVIDRLVLAITSKNDAAVMSPKTLYPDGRLQSCGRPKMSTLTFLLRKLKLWNEQKISSVYTNKKGIFISYHIVGAAFLIKTSIFREIGFFDERFFFCPEDIAVSDQLHKKGYSCYVDESTYLFHHEGTTASRLMLATRPSSEVGGILFYSKNSRIRKNILSIIVVLISLTKALFWMTVMYFLPKKDKAELYSKSYFNVVCAIIANKSPKETFIKYYNTIKK